MKFDLHALARRLITDEAGLIVSLQHPLLICDAALAGDDEALLATRVSGTAALGHGGQAVFEVRKGDSAQNAFGLGITVGRTQNNDIPLDDSSVSRFHAYFVKDAKTGVWRLFDAESSNGTTVEGRTVEPKVPVEIVDGASIRFGNVGARFFTPAKFVAHLKNEMSR